MNKLGFTAKEFAWPILRTLFVETLPANDW